VLQGARVKPHIYWSNLDLGHLVSWSSFPQSWRSLRRMAKGIHGLPKVSLGPAIPTLLRPVGRTPLKRLYGRYGAACPHGFSVPLVPLSPARGTDGRTYTSFAGRSAPVYYWLVFWMIKFHLRFDRPKTTVHRFQQNLRISRSRKTGMMSGALKDIRLETKLVRQL
jgi:hypothetical protein